MKNFGKFIVEGSDIDWLAILTGKETIQDSDQDMPAADPASEKVEAERRKVIQNLGINHNFPMLKRYGLVPLPLEKSMLKIHYPSGLFVQISYMDVPQDGFANDMKFGKQAPRLTPKRNSVTIDAAYAEKALEVAQHTPGKITARYLGFSFQQASAILSLL